MISPLAHVDPSAKIGKNVTVYPFAYIDKNVEIGDNCTIMPYASVLDGTRMGTGNTVYQSAIHDTAILGSGVILKHGCHIGSWTLLRDGCRANKDVPPFIVAAHNPIVYYGVNAVLLSKVGEIH